MVGVTRWPSEGVVDVGRVLHKLVRDAQAELAGRDVGDPRVFVGRARRGVLAELVVTARPAAVRAGGQEQLAEHGVAALKLRIGDALGALTVGPRVERAALDVEVSATGERRPFAL